MFDGKTINSNVNKWKALLLSIWLIHYMCVMVKTFSEYQDWMMVINPFIGFYHFLPWSHFLDGETKVWQFDGNLASHSKPMVHIHTKRGPTSHTSRYFGNVRLSSHARARRRNMAGNWRAQRGFVLLPRRGAVDHWGCPILWLSCLKMLW